LEWFNSLFCKLDLFRARRKHSLPYKMEQLTKEWVKLFPYCSWKLPALLTNIRLGWKSLPGTITLAPLLSIVNYGRKKFLTLGLKGACLGYFFFCLIQPNSKIVYWNRILKWRHCDKARWCHSIIAQWRHRNIAKWRQCVVLLY
jgi:hypothetical protein